MKKQLLSILLVVCMLVSLCQTGMSIAVSGADTGADTGTASAITFSAEYRIWSHYSGLDESRMFDGDLSTEWVAPWSIWNSIHVDFSASERIVLTGFTLISSSNSEHYKTRQPFKIEMRGRISSDDSWTLIHSVSNDNCDVYENNVSFHYDLPDNTAYYKDYQITFYLRSGDEGKGLEDSAVGFAEIVPDYISCVHDWTTDSVIDANCIKPSYTYQHCTGCLDERTLVGAESDSTGHDLDADGCCLNCGRIEPTVVGPFLLSGGGLVEGVDYLWWDHYCGDENLDALCILSEKHITIETVDEYGSRNGKCYISVIGSTSANLTFDGLIMRAGYRYGETGDPYSFIIGNRDHYQVYLQEKCGLTVSKEDIYAEDWSDQVVTLTLKEGSENIIESNNYPIKAITPTDVGEVGKLVINGTGKLTLTGTRAAIGNDVGVSNVEISGGCTVVLNGDMCGIAAAGGGVFLQPTSNITIENSTVIANGWKAGIGGDPISDIRIIGGCFRGTVTDNVQTGADGQPVYLATIPNPNSEPVTVNGVNYTPVNSSFADPDDTNLYAYLSDPTEIKNIRVGDKEAHYHFDSTQNIFRSYMTDTYAWDTDRHWLGCSYDGCNEATDLEAHDYSAFVTDSTSYWKVCHCGSTTAPKAIPTVTLDLAQHVCDRGPIPFTVTTTDGATVLEEESTFTCDNANVIGMYSVDIAENGVQPFNLVLGWTEIPENLCAHIKVKTTDGYVYTVDIPVTVGTDFLAHGDGDANHLCDRCGTRLSNCEDVSPKDHICDYCGETIDSCTDPDKDHVCNWCGAPVGTHEDGNTDHVCDYGCDVAIGACEDPDKDHKCDYGCGKDFGTHEDKDHDHKCDYGCKVAIGACEDLDKDHKCDHGCGKDFGTHEDKDHDHVCDYGCKVAIGDCEDSDKDHKCDYGCGKDFGTHEDLDKDHDCDYCGDGMSDCDDTDPKDHKCDLCGKILSNCSGGKATCRKKAVCGHCGNEYGEVDVSNHASMKHVDAKAATEEAEGNTEYWHCEDCDKYFSDKDGKNEISLSDTVVAKLEPAHQTGDVLFFLIALLLVSGTAMVVTATSFKKRKN